MRFALNLRLDSCVRLVEASHENLRLIGWVGVVLLPLHVSATIHVNPPHSTPHPLCCFSLALPTHHLSRLPSLPSSSLLQSSMSGRFGTKLYTRLGFMRRRTSLIGLLPKTLLYIVLPKAKRRCFCLFQIGRTSAFLRVSDSLTAKMVSSPQSPPTGDPEADDLAGHGASEYPVLARSCS